GMYLMAMIPLGVGLIGLAGRRRRRAVIVIGMAAALVTLAVNSQRSALMQLCVALPLLFIWGRRLTLRTTAYGVLLVTAVLVGGSSIMGSAFTNRVISVRDNIKFALVTAPIERMTQALTQPVLGQGLGIASPGSSRLKVTSDASAESFMAALVYQGGVPLLILFYLILANLFLAGYRSLRRLRVPAYRLFGAAILAYQVEILLQSWTYDPLHYPPNRYIFWFWTGLLLALPRLMHDEVANAPSTA